MMRRVLMLLGFCSILIIGSPILFAGTIDLNGTWRGNNSEYYYVRHAGNEVWWFAEPFENALCSGKEHYTQVAHGHIKDSKLYMSWANLKKYVGTGTITLKIESNAKMILEERSNEIYTTVVWSR